MFLAITLACVQKFLLSDGRRLIPFEANCCMRCSQVDPCFQFVFWLDVWHFMVAVCHEDAFFVLSPNLAVWFVSGSLVSPSSASPAVGHSLVFLSVLSSSSLEFSLQLFSCLPRHQTAGERSCHLGEEERESVSRWVF